MTDAATRFGWYRDRLAAAGVPVEDGDVDWLTVTHPDYYTLSDEVLTTRRAAPREYPRELEDVQVTLRALCVSKRSKNAVRDMADMCRAQLTGYSPRPGVDDPLEEISSGPVLTDRSGHDIRYSVAITHRAIAKRDTTT